MRGWNGMSENGILANIFRMGDQVKRNLRDFAGNPGDYLDNVAHQNNIEWKKDPIERSMGFFNPVPLGNVSPFMLRKQMKEAIAEIPKVENSIYSKMPGQTLTDTKYVQRNIRDQAELDHIISSGYLLPKEGGKAKKYFTAVDEVNPDVPTGNTMIRIAREKVSPNEAVSAKDVERFNFSLNSWEPLIKEPSVNMSRRDFMKKSGGIAAGTAAASIPGAKLLQKFAPEERTLAKEANVAKQAAVEAAPKYKYNSLKEYLDDVETSVYSKYDEPWFDEVNDLTARQQIQQRLLRDEQAYVNAKDVKSGYLKLDNPTGDEYKIMDEILNDFSPQAKKEMKLLKDKSVSLDRTYGGTDPEHEVWTSWLANSKGDIDSTLKALQELK